MTGNNPHLNCANMNANIKFDENLFICFQDIELKRNFTSIKGHNSVTNRPKR